MQIYERFVLSYSDFFSMRFEIQVSQQRWTPFTRPGFKRRQQKCHARRESETKAIEIIPFVPKERTLESQADENEIVEEIPKFEAAVSNAETNLSLENLKSRIFDDKTDSLKEFNPKPLKVNRDLKLVRLSSTPSQIFFLQYHAKNYRRRGVVSSNPKKRLEWFKKAEFLYRQVLEMDPTDCRPYVGLGKVYEEQKRFDEARKIYEDGCIVSGGAAFVPFQTFL